MVADEVWQGIALIAVIVVGGVLSILYMFQSYGRTFWHASVAWNGSNSARSRTVLILALAGAILVLGLWPEPLIALSDLASTTLIPRSTP
jgi:multicomponent Na+:H+ antiporter subunit D